MNFERPQAAWHVFRPGSRIYLAGCCGEPTGCLDVLVADPDLGRGLSFTGVWIPGVNERDPTDGVPGAHARTFFVTRALRAGFADGRIGFAPLHYTAIYEWLAGPARLDGAIFQVSPPCDGMVSLGLAADFTPAVLESGARLVGEINPEMPFVGSAPSVPVERFETLVEAETPLLGYSAGALSTEMMAIGQHVASLIEPGDTLQLGIGKVQAAVLAHLTDHRDLAFHGGMISEPILEPLARGVFGHGQTAGVALGSSSLYREVAGLRSLRLASVGETHSVSTLAAIERSVSVNSVMEIDLFGQANAEMLDGRQISGHGGLVEFSRGARLSRGGRSILALPSTAEAGRISRIRPALAERTVATVARSDADYVVTEFGAADLRWRDIDARASSLIEVAHPTFKGQLADAWDTMRRNM